MSPNYNIGDLPYGYNPYSTNLTIPDDGWGGTKWNLSNPQVRAQMTLPLIANQNASLGFYNQGNIFPGYGNQTGDFYSSLLQSQASQGGISPLNSSGGDMMSGIFGLMLRMKQAQAKQSNATESSNSTSSSKSSNSDEADSAKSEESKTGKKKFTYDSAHPLKALKKFVNNTNDETTFKFEDFESFKSDTYKSMKKDDKVSLDKILKTFGIDTPSDKAGQIAIKRLVSDKNNVTEKEYEAILKGLKIDEDSAGISLSKKEFNENKTDFAPNTQSAKEKDSYPTKTAGEIVDLIKNKDKEGLYEKINNMSNEQLKQVSIAFNKIQKAANRPAGEDFYYWIKKTCDETDAMCGTTERTTKILDRLKTIKNEATESKKATDASNNAKAIELTKLINEAYAVTTPKDKDDCKKKINALVKQLTADKNLTQVINAFNLNQDNAIKKPGQTESYKHFTEIMKDIGTRLR